MAAGRDTPRSARSVQGPREVKKRRILQRMRDEAQRGARGPGGPDRSDGDRFRRKPPAQESGGGFGRSSRAPTKPSSRDRFPSSTSDRAPGAPADRQTARPAGPRSDFSPSSTTDKPRGPRGPRSDFSPSSTTDKPRGPRGPRSDFSPSSRDPHSAPKSGRPGGSRPPRGPFSSEQRGGFKPAKPDRSRAGAGPKRPRGKKPS